MRTLNKKTLERMEAYIQKYCIEKGVSPSYRNIMHGIGMTSLNLVQRYVLALEAQGRIKRTNLGNIDIPQRLDKGETVVAPLVGQIACGQPNFAEENIEELVLRQQDYADEGEIVVALVGENATLKRFYKRGHKIILHPENKGMRDIVVDDCQIQGVLVSCIKIY